MSTQITLLRQKKFLPLFVTQFLGAMNDNVLKNSLVVLLAFNSAQWSDLRIEVLSNLAAGIFILPFLLFSATAGQLADKFDKAILARWVKALEVLIIVVVATGFFMHSLGVLFGALFLLGCHSALFGPIKYALLPQHLRTDELIGGNALIEAGTFVAILAGTLLGGMLASQGDASTQWIIAVALLVALVGFAASCFIPKAQAPAPELRLQANFLHETWHTVRLSQHDATVFLSILGISWFWLYGSLLLAQFPAYAKLHLSGTESSVTLLLAVFTLGIGLGSLACERLSTGRVELGLVPLGAIGLTVFGFDFALAAPAAGTLLEAQENLHIQQAIQHLTVGQLLHFFSVWRLLADLLLLGVFGGFYIVPLYAIVQQRAEEKHRARIIAANNIVNALFMVAGALFSAFMLHVGVTIPMLFAVAAMMNAAVAIYMFVRLPEFFSRFLSWLSGHSL